jgi:hypothetical protein
MPSGKLVSIAALDLQGTKGPVQWQRHPTKDQRFFDYANEKFDANNPEIFNKWALLDVVTNYAEKHDEPAKHHTVLNSLCLRGHAMELTKPMEPEVYQRYRNLTAMVGPSLHNIQSMQRIEGSCDYDAAARYVKNPTDVVSRLVPVIHPEVCKDDDYRRDDGVDSPECDHNRNFTAPDDFLYVDLTYPLRGIYLPLKAAMNGNPCMYAHFDFTQEDYELEQYTYNPDLSQGEVVDPEPGISQDEKDRQVKDAGEREAADPPLEPRITSWSKSPQDKKLNRDAYVGWGVLPGWTARFKVEALKELAKKPSSEQDPKEYIKLFDSKGVLIRWGGKMDIRMGRVYNDPVHTMNDEEVVRLLPGVVKPVSPVATLPIGAGTAGSGNSDPAPVNQGTASGTPDVAETGTPDVAIPSRKNRMSNRKDRSKYSSAADQS